MIAVSGDEIPAKSVRTGLEVCCGVGIPAYELSVVASGGGVESILGHGAGEFGAAERGFRGDACTGTLVAAASAVWTFES